MKEILETITKIKIPKIIQDHGIRLQNGFEPEKVIWLIVFIMKDCFQGLCTTTCQKDKSIITRIETTLNVVILEMV